MSIDKSYTKLKNRLFEEYWHSIEDVINLASRHLNSNELIRGLCKKCLNRSWEKLSKVNAHIIDHGFHPNYKVLIYHNEKVYSQLSSFLVSGSGIDGQ